MLRLKNSKMSEGRSLRNEGAIKCHLVIVLIVSWLTNGTYAADPTSTPSATPTAGAAATAGSARPALTPSSSPVAEPSVSSAPSASAAGTAAKPQKNIDVTQIVTRAGAEKVLGETVRDPAPVNRSSADGYYSKCTYFGDKSGRSLLLRVRQASAGSIDPQKEFEEVAASGGAMKPIEGLGDKAGMFNGTPQNGLPANVIMLYVVKGNAFLTVGIGGIKDEELALEKAKEAARKILAKL